MTRTQLKNSLHRLVDNSKNNKLLNIVYELLNSDQKDPDWWETLTIDQKAILERSLKEVHSGKTVPHRSVMAKYKGKYT